MKRIFIAIAAVAGVGGLIALMGYHPKNNAGATSTSSQGGTTGNTLSDSTPGNTPVPAAGSGGGKFKDGTYTGGSVDVGYGTVQVAAVISGGRLTGINFLQMPFEAQHSAEIASQAKPILEQEAISAQSANVDLVTGATSDWEGFTKSLQAALDQAKA